MARGKRKRSRRGPGEGTIVQRADGRWMARVRLGREGKKPKYIYGRTFDEAREKLTLFNAERDQGLPVAPERQTVAQFFHTWLEQVVKPHRRPATYACYSDLSRKHIVPALGHVQLQKLTAQQVLAFQNDKRRDGYSGRTVQLLHDILGIALEQARRWGLVRQNVARLVERPHLDPPPPRHLEQDQAKTFLTALQGHRLEALFLLTLATGLRRSEVLGLTWDKISYEEGTITVSRTLQRIRGEWRYQEPKTARGHRTFSLPAFALAALRAHRVRQLEQQALAGWRWDDCGLRIADCATAPVGDNSAIRNPQSAFGGLVFCTRFGTPLDPRSVKRQLDRILKGAGLPHVRFHDLRHTVATLLHDEGVPIKAISEMLGHADERTTWGLYVHNTERKRKETAEAAERLFGKGS